MRTSSILEKEIPSDSSDSKFFRTNTGIQSGTDAFNKSRFIMALLIIFGAIEILCGFKILQEGKASK